MLEIAATLCLLIGVLHSYLGERFILIRLFRSDQIPHLLGSDHFTKRTLRFAWHITTIAWWGFAYLLWEVSYADQFVVQTVLYTTSSVFFLSGLLSLGFTAGRHLSWVVFWIIAGLVYFVAGNS